MNGLTRQERNTISTMRDLSNSLWADFAKALLNDEIPDNEIGEIYDYLVKISDTVSDMEQLKRG